MTDVHSATPADLVTVRLVEVPVAVRLRSLEHGDGLMREMTLLTMRDDTSVGVPHRLVELANLVMAQYGPQVNAAAAETQKAHEQGLEMIPELVYRMPPEAAGVARDIAQVLDEVDEYCRAGEHLLSLATPPDVALYRAWTLQEFDRQMAGGAPVPWPVYRDAAAS